MAAAAGSGGGGGLGKVMGAFWNNNDMSDVLLEVRVEPHLPPVESAGVVSAAAGKRPAAAEGTAAPALSPRSRAIQQGDAPKALLNLHKIVLCGHSHYFRTQMGWLERQQEQQEQQQQQSAAAAGATGAGRRLELMLMLPPDEADVVEQALKAMYTGRLEVPPAASSAGDATGDLLRRAAMVRLCDRLQAPTVLGLAMSALEAALDAACPLVPSSLPPRPATATNSSSALRRSPPPGMTPLLFGLIEELQDEAAAAAAAATAADAASEHPATAVNACRRGRASRLGFDLRRAAVCRQQPGEAAGGGPRTGCSINTVVEIATSLGGLLSPAADQIYRDRLLGEYGDVPLVMSDPAGRLSSFLALPLKAVVYVASDDRLLVASENDVVALLQLWLEARHPSLTQQLTSAAAAEAAADGGGPPSEVSSSVGGNSQMPAAHRPPESEQQQHSRLRAAAAEDKVGQTVASRVASRRRRIASAAAGGAAYFSAAAAEASFDAHATAEGSGGNEHDTAVAAAAAAAAAPTQQQQSTDPLLERDLQELRGVVRPLQLTQSYIDTSMPVMSCWHDHDEVLTLLKLQRRAFGNPRIAQALAQQLRSASAAPSAALSPATSGNVAASAAEAEAAAAAAAAPVSVYLALQDESDQALYLLTRSRESSFEEECVVEWQLQVPALRWAYKKAKASANGTFVVKSPAETWWNGYWWRLLFGWNLGSRDAHNTHWISFAARPPGAAAAKVAAAAAAAAGTPTPGGQQPQQERRVLLTVDAALGCGQTLKSGDVMSVAELEEQAAANRGLLSQFAPDPVAGRDQSRCSLVCSIPPRALEAVDVDSNTRYLRLQESGAAADDDDGGGSAIDASVLAAGSWGWTAPLTGGATKPIRSPVLPPRDDEKVGYFGDGPASVLEAIITCHAIDRHRYIPIKVYLKQLQ